MIKKVFLSLFLLLPLACSFKDDPAPAASRQPDGEVYHDMIQLGEKLEDPYTVANMQEALTKAYPSKAGRVQIEATDLYVRFLPADDAQLGMLKDLGLYLLDHPMDYSILREGDYYKDPSVGEEAITWQYAVVPKSFVFPAGIRYELLDECFFAEHQSATKAAEGVDWALVEREAFRLTGNEGMLEAVTKAGASAPAGRITIEDPRFSGGKPFGVSGVMVAANVFVRIATAYTDRDGYYKMDKTFSGKPRYRLVFKNEKGFNIGLNLIVIPASVSTLGKGSPEGIDYHVTASGDGALFRRCAVNNAAYDYFSRCTREELDVTPPPGDLRIWIFPHLRCSSACMLHHGAFLEDGLLSEYLGDWLWLVKMLLPDVTIGTKEEDYAGIYRAVTHELAHASHYGKVGNAFWNPYIKYVLKSYVLEAWNAYGSGTREDANYCEIGEMWAYFLQETLYKERYGGTVATFGNTFWFKPDIFVYLYERGLSRGQIFRALTADVTTMEDLKETLLNLYPALDDVIENTFRYFGK